MTVLAADMREFIEKRGVAYVATVDKDGMPNVSPKGTIRVWDDQTLVFADVFSEKTRRNLQENPHVAVLEVNVNSFKGYQFKGTAEVLSDGPIYDSVVESLASSQPDLPKPKNVIKINVEDVFTVTFFVPKVKWETRFI